MHADELRCLAMLGRAAVHVRYAKVLGEQLHLWCRDKWRKVSSFSFAVVNLQ